jgi:hypothetical protein
MKTMFACAAVIVALTGSAMAGGLYDKKLEAFVQAKVAAKIGDMRGGFDYGQKVQFLRTEHTEIDGVTTGSVADAGPLNVEPAMIEMRRSLMQWMYPRKVRVVF